MLGLYLLGWYFCNRLGTYLLGRCLFYRLIAPCLLGLSRLFIESSCSLSVFCLRS